MPELNVAELAAKHVARLKADKNYMAAVEMDPNEYQKRMQDKQQRETGGLVQSVHYVQPLHPDTLLGPMIGKGKGHEKEIRAYMDEVKREKKLLLETLPELSVKEAANLKLTPEQAAKVQRLFEGLPDDKKQILLDSVERTEEAGRELNRNIIGLEVRDGDFEAMDAIRNAAIIEAKQEFIKENEIPVPGKKASLKAGAEDIGALLEKEPAEQESDMQKVPLAVRNPAKKQAFIG